MEFAYDMMYTSGEGRSEQQATARSFQSEREHHHDWVEVEARFCSSMAFAAHRRLSEPALEEHEQEALSYEWALHAGKAPSFDLFVMPSPDSLTPVCQAAPILILEVSLY